MVQVSTLTKLAAVGLAAVSSAHPGHEEHALAPEVKRSFLANTRRSLDSCAEHLERRGTLRKAEERRKAFAQKHRKRSTEHPGHYLQIRDTDAILNTSHHSDLTGITTNTEESVFFTNTTCILAPEGEIGPFWVTGELVREDIVDDEPGIVNYMHAQFIDINTCEPIENLYWDVWNCNSTGVYSGVQDDSNGNGDDASNLNNTALRGIQKTDELGVATFKSVFPGHYSGRATHVHVVAHLNATLLPNNTLTGGSVPHIGQLFFDQDLITAVEATYPYNTNNISITLNSADRVVGLETEDSNSDPLFEYVLLGDSVEDGIFSWITIGVDTSATYNTSYAAALTSSGGVANEQSQFGGGDMPAGGAPSGVPSGAPSGATALSCS